MSSGSVSDESELLSKGADTLIRCRTTAPMCFHDYHKNMHGCVCFVILIRIHETCCALSCYIHIITRSNSQVIL